MWDVVTFVVKQRDMEQQFKLGDVVQLKSGSPKMIVAEIDGDSVSMVYWNDKTDRIQKVDAIVWILELANRVG